MTLLTVNVPGQVVRLVEQIEKLESCTRNEALTAMMYWAAGAASRELKINAEREKRFQSFVDKTPGQGPNGDCWIWRGLIDPKGYARFKVRHRYVTAHRKMFLDVRGVIPDGLVCDHLCRVRHCVNPYHIELVTGIINTKRGDSGKWQQSKTHCPRGHEYSEENTYRYRTSRSCRKCRKISEMKSKAKRKERQNG